MAIVAGVSLVWGSAATAQDSGEVSAAVHGGTCDDLGSEVASLDAPRPDRGDWVGVENLGVVLESETDDVAPGEDLLSSPHSVVVFSEGNPVACGEIGGYVDDDDLRIGLQPVDDSGYFGIASIDDIDDDDDDDEVEIDLSVFQPAI